MSRRSHLFLASVAVAAALGVPTVALAQSGGVPPELERGFSPVRIGERAESPAEREARRRGEQLGRLLFVRIDLDVEGVPAREVVRQLSAALDVSIVGLWARGERFDGLDPETPVTLQLKQAIGLDALEAVAAAIVPIDDEVVTWQFHGSGIEIGSKDRLGRRAAIVRRTYDANELVIQVPNFRLIGRESYNPAPRRPTPTPAEREYLKRGGDPEADPEVPSNFEGSDEKGVVRFTIEQMAAEFGMTLRESVEPDVWENGDSRMIFRDGLLIVVAPDYVHRIIGGYPYPIVVPPDAAADVTAPRADQPVAQPSRPRG